MKALRFYAPEDLRLEQVPEPTPAPDEVKIRVRNCSTCGTDVKIRKNGHPNLSPPRIIGHEIAGEIVEIGDRVAGDWKVGDRVQVIAAVPCGDCHECRKGWMAVCQNQTSVGYQYDGGFAEYMIVPPQVLKVDGMNRIPDQLSFAEASAAEPFACAINAQEQLGIEPGDDVVIFGAGPIGCMHARIARGVHKAGRIILVDINPERLAMSAAAVRWRSRVDRMGRISMRGVLVIGTSTGSPVRSASPATPATRRRRGDHPPEVPGCAGRVRTHPLSPVRRPARKTAFAPVRAPEDPAIALPRRARRDRESVLPAWKNRFLSQIEGRRQTAITTLLHRGANRGERLTGYIDSGRGSGPPSPVAPAPSPQ